MVRFLPLAVVLLLASALPVDAQESLLVRIDSIDSSAYPELRAVVTVLDETGRPVTGLGSAAFSATVDGSPVSVSQLATVEDEGLGIGVVMTFDVSGSMAGQPLEEALQAGLLFVEELTGNDQAAVIAFGTQVDTVQPFTGDLQAVAAAISGLFVSGDTALYQAVVHSIAVAQQADTPRRAIVLLSDGFEFGGHSDATAESSLAAAAAAGIPVYIAGLGAFIDFDYLEELAAVTRGQFLEAPGPADLQAVYQTMGSVLRRQYVLTLDAGDVAAGPGSVLRLAVQHEGVTADTEADLGIAAPVEPVTPPPTEPPPVPTAEPPTVGPPLVQPGDSDGASIPWLVLVGVAGIGAAGVMTAVLLARRRRARAVPAAGDEGEMRPLTAASVAPAGEAFPAAPVTPAAAPENSPVRVRVVTGGEPRAYPLGDAPVTIGFWSDCDIRLHDPAAASFERVRIWRREGRYMLHNLSRLGAVSIKGKAVAWAILESGDEIRIGNATIIFESTDPPPPPTTPDPPKPPAPRA